MPFSFFALQEIKVCIRPFSIILKNADVPVFTLPYPQLSGDNHTTFRTKKQGNYGTFFEVFLPPPV
jgi:hypothetical protein